MNKVYLNINEAYIVLKEGLVVLDLYNNRFKIIKDRIVVKGDNSRFNLEEKEFLSIYKNSKFLILEDSNETIDATKDEEYYNFKHK